MSTFTARKFTVQVLKPSEYLTLSPATRNRIEKVEVLPPTLGKGSSKDFGKIRVTFKSSAYEVEVEGDEETANVQPRTQYTARRRTTPRRRFPLYARLGAA